MRSQNKRQTQAETVFPVAHSLVLSSVTPCTPVGQARFEKAPRRSKFRFAGVKSLPLPFVEYSPYVAREALPTIFAPFVLL